MTIVAIVMWALAGLVLQFLWKVLRGYILKSPLDVIPGPEPASAIKGTLIILLHIPPFLNGAILGNITQLFSRDAWSFLDSLTDEYQSVVKMHGMYGVCVTFI